MGSCWEEASILRTTRTGALCGMSSSLHWLKHCQRVACTWGAMLRLSPLMMLVSSSLGESVTL